MVICKKITHECPNCPDSKNFIEDYKNGYNLCGECGCTIGPRIIDEGSEWRSFGDSTGADPSRVGGPSNPLLDTEQLDTLISGTHSLAKTQLRSTMRGPERGLLNGFNLINTFCDRGYITQKIQDQAKVYYKTVSEKKLTKGKNTEAVVAACIHLACKFLKCPRTFKEISVVCNVPKEEVGKSYKLIEKHFEKMKNLSTEDVVERFCSALDLSIEIQKMAVRISKRASECGCIAGKSPVSVAAAVIYMVSYLYKTEKKIQKEIQSVTKVSEVTIKNTYKELLANKELLLTTDDFAQEIIDSLPNA